MTCQRCDWWLDCISSYVKSKYTIWVVTSYHCRRLVRTSFILQFNQLTCIRSLPQPLWANHLSLTVPFSAAVSCSVSDSSHPESIGPSSQHITFSHCSLPPRSMSTLICKDSFQISSSFFLCTVSNKLIKLILFWIKSLLIDWNVITAHSVLTALSVCPQVVCHQVQWLSGEDSTHRVCNASSGECLPPQLLLLLHLWTPALQGRRVCAQRRSAAVQDWLWEGERPAQHSQSRQLRLR